MEEQRFIVAHSLGGLVHDLLSPVCWVYGKLAPYGVECMVEQTRHEKAWKNWVPRVPFKGVTQVTSYESLKVLPHAPNW